MIETTQILNFILDELTQTQTVQYIPQKVGYDRLHLDMGSIQCFKCYNIIVFCQ